MESGGSMSVLDQVKALEGTGGMPVMFIVTPRDASNDQMPWSLINSVHVRMFSINSQTAPDAADYLTHSHTLTQIAYALDIPPKVAGQKPVVVLWENERDGVLTQPTLEAIYKKVGIEVDPLTAPPLNETSWNNFLIKAANHVPNTPSRLVILAFHSNGSDPDVVSTTKLRILAGVEFIKSTMAPVTELDEDAHSAIAAKLVPSTVSNGPLLIVFNLVDRRVEGVYDPSKLTSLTEGGFQTFALQNGVPSFLNTRTDVAEAFIRVADQLRKQQQASNTTLTPAGGLQDASLTLVKQ
jgi:hypothetical protein